jgi:hypothetical protein
MVSQRVNPVLSISAQPLQALLKQTNDPHDVFGGSIDSINKNIKEFNSDNNPFRTKYAGQFLDIKA